MNKRVIGIILSLIFLLATVNTAIAIVQEESKIQNTKVNNSPDLKIEQLESWRIVLWDPASKWYYVIGTYITFKNIGNSFDFPEDGIDLLFRCDFRDGKTWNLLGQTIEKNDFTWENNDIIQFHTRFVIIEQGGAREPQNLEVVIDPDNKIVELDETNNNITLDKIPKGALIEGTVYGKTLLGQKQLNDALVECKINGNVYEHSYSHFWGHDGYYPLCVPTGKTLSITASKDGYRTNTLTCGPLHSYEYITLDFLLKRKFFDIESNPQNIIQSNPSGQPLNKKFTATSNTLFGTSDNSPISV